MNLPGPNVKIYERGVGAGQVAIFFPVNTPIKESEVHKCNVLAFWRPAAVRHFIVFHLFASSDFLFLNRISRPYVYDQ